MTRFAVTVTIVEITLTIVAVWLVTLTDPPIAGEFLLPADFQTAALGRRIESTRRETVILPGAEIRHKHWCEYDGHGYAYAEVRLGVARRVFSDQLAAEQESAAKPRPEPALYTVTEQKWLGDRSFLVRRLYPTPAGARVEGELWVLQRGALILARMTMLDVPEEKARRSLDECETFARNIAGIAWAHGMRVSPEFQGRAAAP